MNFIKQTSGYKNVLILLAASLTAPTSIVDVNIYQNDTIMLDSGFFLQAAGISGKNSWFGKSKENIGNDSDHWFETSIEPNIKAEQAD